MTVDDENERPPLPSPTDGELDDAERRLPKLDLWLGRQEGLAELGFDVGRVDGIPGRRTYAALRAFQSSAGLEADGIWGPKTRAALELRLLRQLPRELPDGVPSFAPEESYIDLLGDVEVDEGFWAAWIDLTSKSPVSRRKGKRKALQLKRIVWHQAGFCWRPYRERGSRYTSHHKINAHLAIDRDGTLLLLHPFDAYLWTANAFNPDCLSIELIGNFEATLGKGDWYKPDKFGRARPTRIQLIRARQLTLWLLQPTAHPQMPEPLVRWMATIITGTTGSTFKWVNGHREGTDDRPSDPGSEVWWNLIEWAIARTRLVQGPRAGRGQEIPTAWRVCPVAPPTSETD